MTEQRVTPVFDDTYVVCSISNAAGKDEGIEFISSRDTRDQTRFEYLLRKLADGFHLKSPEHMRAIGVKDPKNRGAKVHEIKTHNNGGQRLYVVEFEKRWYITHGSKKVSDKQVPKQAAKAFSIFWASDEGDK